MLKKNLNREEPSTNQQFSTEGYSLEIFIFITGCLVVLGMFGIENVKAIFREKPREEERDNDVMDNCDSSTSENSCYSLHYNNPTFDQRTLWSNMHSGPPGINQSPINIRTALAIVIKANESKPWSALSFNRQYFMQPHSMTIVNDGYGLMLGTCFENMFPKINGGPLKHKYRFNMVQFKWGPTDDEGSEHTINLKRYAMEMQLMHIKGKHVYKSLECAVKNRAVAYLSFLFEVTPVDNPYLEPLVGRLRFVKNPNSTHTLDPFPLNWLFHPFKSKYYYYQGSITYPPCTEGVKWIIQPKPLSISHRQLNEFRNLRSYRGPMLWNSRPVQNLNDRTINFYL